MAETPNTSAPRRFHQSATRPRDRAGTFVTGSNPVLAWLPPVLDRLLTLCPSRASVQRICKIAVYIAPTPRPAAMDSSAKGPGQPGLAATSQQFEAQHALPAGLVRTSGSPCRSRYALAPAGLRVGWLPDPAVLPRR